MLFKENYIIRKSTPERVMTQSDEWSGLPAYILGSSIVTLFSRTTAIAYTSCLYDLLHFLVMLGRLIALKADKLSSFSMNFSPSLQKYFNSEKIAAHLPHLRTMHIIICVRTLFFFFFGKLQSIMLYASFCLYVQQLVCKQIFPHTLTLCNIGLLKSNECLYVETCV